MKKQIVPDILSASGVFIMSVIGAGFASGQEIYSFFSVSGLFGAVGILLAGFLFICYGCAVFGDGYEARSLVDEENVIDYSIKKRFHKYIGKCVTLCVFSFSFAMLIVMLSCMNTINSTVFSSEITCVTFTAALCFFSLLFGKKLLDLIGTILSPIMIVMIASFCIFRISEVIRSDGAGFFMTSLSGTKDIPLRFVGLSFRYTGYNCLSTIPVFVICGYHMKSRKSVVLSGIIGGVILTILMLLIFLTLCTFNVSEEVMPMLSGAKISGKIWYVIYTAALFFSVYTTAVSLLYGITETVTNHIKIPKKLILFSLCIISAMLSLFGFKTLIDIFYPLFGYIGGIVLIFFFLKLPFRIK